MAFDTENKRLSMFAHGLQGLTILPIADGAIAGPDGPHCLGLFAASGLPIEPPDGPDIIKFVQGAWKLTKSFMFMQGDR
jgi:hypothetical protein